MKIIDFHTHIYPDALAEAGSRSIGDFYGLHAMNDGSVDTLIRKGSQAGISEYVLLPVSVKPEHIRHINEFTAQTARLHPEFYGFGTVHAGCDDVAAVADSIVKLGLKGVKLHPDVQRTAIDDKRLYPLYDSIQGRLPVLIHCGDTRYEYSRPEKLRRVLHEFPRLTVIGAHLGGWSMFDAAFKYLLDENCMFDFSSCIMFIGEKATQRYIKSYGAERILFGTDFPLWNPVQEVERFMSLDLSPAERELIAHLNAERILNNT